MGKKKRLIRKRKSSNVFTYRGYQLEDLVGMTNEQFFRISSARSKRNIRRGWRVPTKFYKKVRKAKADCRYGDTPRMVRTHLRNLVVTPELIGSVVGVHNGQFFIKVLIQKEMLGHKLGEFSMAFKPVKHGKPGIGGTKSSKFVPLK